MFVVPSSGGGVRASTPPPEGGITNARLVHVSDRTMATHAGNAFIAFCRMRRNSLRQIGMAFHAGLFSDFQIAFADLNRFVKSASGEIKRMPESVGSLGQVFANSARRRVAIVASRHRAMRRLHPSIVLFVHHMAIGAGLRIVGQIGITFGVNKGVNTNADSYAHQSGKNDSSQCSDFHFYLRQQVRAFPHKVNSEPGDSNKFAFDCFTEIM